MIRRFVEKILGPGAWEDVDHEEVQRQLDQEQKKREPDFQRADEFEYDHFTDAIDDIKQLKRDSRHEEVKELLWWCIEYAEAEEQRRKEIDGFAGLPPAYYRHLAIVYRKDGEYSAEVDVLERYVSRQREFGSATDSELTDRLERARELAAE